MCPQFRHFDLGLRRFLRRYRWGATLPAMILVSFDIDGTLIAGDPAGPIDFDMVRESKVRGFIIGSGSDRTLAHQQSIWDDAGIECDFVSHKHHLPAIKERFSCDRYIHIGDTQIDEHYAILAGFEFFHVDDLPAPGSLGWVY